MLPKIARGATTNEDAAALGLEVVAVELPEGAEEPPLAEADPRSVAVLTAWVVVGATAVVFWVQVKYHPYEQRVKKGSLLKNKYTHTDNGAKSARLRRELVFEKH